MTEEFDTDDEGDQVAVMQQDRHSFSPLEHVASDESMSWGDLLVADEDGPFMPSNLDLGGRFGPAGPSVQGNLVNWKD